MMPEPDYQLAPSPLVAAARLLAERNVYGLVWFGPDLVTSARYGGLASFVEIGEPVAEACLPLTGLEGDILSLRDAPGHVLDLPAVAIKTGSGDLPRLNITIFWFVEGQHFLMLLARSVSRSDLEAELSQQMRARLIAESELAAKSRELARANIELERANRDLEDFAAVISHDLKAPLRALRYAAEDMAPMIAAGDIAAARQRLDEITQRTRRMSDMMTALLDYASVGRKSDTVEVVDTRAVIDVVVRSLTVPPGFTVSIQGDWPTLETARAPLDLVIRNLTENAVKHHDRVEGSITICARRVTGALEIDVGDDGPGIPPHLHEAVLLPFRTASADGASTGMGLAFVARTVEQIGGSLYIRSDPAIRRGTVFTLRWPEVIRG
ncbi:MAG: HAMP domain-containing histidine kinase [Hyphomicrobiaceae bacterium]|nr:HAMP domain-containing histidine kinase [Hyphomicrobiaceae bacterium]